MLKGDNMLYYVIRCDANYCNVSSCAITCGKGSRSLAAAKDDFESLHQAPGHH